MAKSRNSRSWKIAEKTIFAALQILKENDLKPMNSGE